MPRRDGGRAVDRHHRLEAALLLVGIHVGEFGARLQRLSELRSPQIQVGRRIGQQRELILRVRLPAADANVLHRLQEGPRAGHVAERGAQLLDHLVGGELALALRFQRNEHEAGVGLPAAGETGHAVHRRILADDLHHLRELAFHRLERRALVGLNAADQPARVLLRKEALRHDDVQPDVQSDGQRAESSRSGADAAAPSRACAHNRDAST